MSEMIRYEDIALDRLDLNPDNVNEMGDSELESLVRHIRSVGMIEPIQVIPTQDGRFMILGGEHRYKAAKEIGMPSIPAVVITDPRFADKDLLDLTAFKLNVIKGKQDPIKFVKLYEKMAAKYGQDAVKEVFAVSDKTLWKKLTKNLISGLKESGVPGSVLDEIEKAGNSAPNLEKMAKRVGKILSSVKGGSEYGAMIFTHGDSKSIIISVDENLFKLMEFLSAYSSSTSVKMSDLLFKPIAELVSSVSPDSQN